MKIVGVTGGIGSGKSTVCEVFKLLGIPVYSADYEARRITDHDSQVRAQIEDLFGPEVYDGHRLNRKMLADIVFSNPDLLKCLNRIVHPAVANHFQQWLDSNNHHPMVIKEAAILFESGSYVDLDFIITVIAPEELRISRVMKRDGISRQQVLDRIIHQWPDERKKDLSDFIILCDEKHLVIDQVLDIYNKLL